MVNLEKMAEHASEDIKTLVMDIIVGIKNINSINFMAQMMMFEKYKSYTYSIPNQWLLQILGAEWCQSIEGWKKYNRRVILDHPVQYWVWAPRIGKKIQTEVRRPDGTVHLDESKGFFGYKEVRTWDISQTEQIPGKPVIEFKEAVGNWPVIEMVRLKAAIKKQFKIDVIETRDAIGRYGKAKEVGEAKKVFINIMYSYNDQMISLCHEMAHILLDHCNKVRKTNHTVREIEAEGVAAMVTKQIVGKMEDGSMSYIRGIIERSKNEAEDINFLKMIEVSASISNFFKYLKPTSADMDK